MKGFRKYFFFIGLAFLSLSIVSCGRDDPQESIEFIVYPGVGVNDIDLGDLGSKAVSVLGDDYFELTNTWGTNDALFYMTFDRYDIQFSLGIHPENSNVESLPIVTAKFFGDFTGMTEEGIKIGSTLDEVEAIYGEGDEDAFGSHSYDDRGIFLNYDDNNLVEDFSIYVP